MLNILTFIISSATLIGICCAGLQVPLVIVNFSPHEVKVDMTYDENCIKHDFNPVNLHHYYNSWESNNLGNFDEDYAPFNDYLQQYKSQFGLPKLWGQQAPMSGTTTIPALSLNTTNLAGAPFKVFETEMDGSGSCFGSHSGKLFALNVNGQTEKFTIEDPPTSEWTLSQYYPNNTRIVLGSGGHAAWGLVTLEAITLVAAIVTAGAAAGAIGSGALVIDAVGTATTVGIAADTAALSSVFYGVAGGTFLGVVDWIAKHRNDDSEQSSNQTLTTDINTDDFYKGFEDVYSTLDEDKRRACVLGLNILGNYDCLVAGVSLIVQGNGKVVAVPLPNIYRAWN